MNIKSWSMNASKTGAYARNSGQHTRPGCGFRRPRRKMESADRQPRYPSHLFSPAKDARARALTAFQGNDLSRVCLAKNYFLPAVLLASLIWTHPLRSAEPAATTQKSSGQVAFADPLILKDPEALRQSNPRLLEQRFWKDFATPEEAALFDGPKTVYPEVPKSEYDLTGFDPTLLGSKVPPAGVHPRVLFSPEDIPTLKARLDGSKQGKKARMETAWFLDRTLFNPASDEGKIFAKLASGDCADLKWEVPESPVATAPTAPPAAPDHWFAGYKKSASSSVHTAYLPNMFVAAALQCLLDGDDKRGRQVAAAAANYYKLRGPVIEKLADELQEKKIAPKDYWRSIGGQLGGNHVGFCYDLAARWMDDEQKAIMRRAVAQATSHRLAYGMNGPARWAETNWTGWDLEHFITALAIEGEEGFDATIPEAAKRTLKGYLQWGISPDGTIFESNGKNGGGLNYAMISAAALARRGENFFGHPHLRKLTAAQAQTVVPFGGGSVDNGTWGSGLFGSAHFFVDFFPNDKAAGFLLRQAEPKLAAFNPEQYRRDLEGDGKKPGKIDLRKISLLTPTHVLGPTIYTCVDWPGVDDPKNAVAREALGLPPDAVDPVQGRLVSRSGDDADALFLMFEARANLSTIGHQQHDAGHFYLAANGEMWAVEAGPKSGYSSDHNVIRIDGLGLADVAYPPRVSFLGANTSPDGALATAELTNAYNHGWVGPTQFQWTIPDAKDWKISVETDPDVVAFFRGTQHDKMRIWGGSYFDQNWGPTMRVASANPVKSAFRTAGIVRGKHPYALIVDDTDKGDSREHLYEWTMQVPSSVSLAEVAMPKDNPAATVLVKTPGSDDWRSPNLQPAKPGTPALLVVLLDVPMTAAPQLWNFFKYTAQPFRLETQTHAGSKPGEIIARTKLVAPRRAEILRSRIALIPFRIGDELPQIRWDPEKCRTTIAWKDQKDTLNFPLTDGRTRVSVLRDGKPILEGK